MKIVTYPLNLFIWFFCLSSFSQQLTIDDSVSLNSLIENTLIQGCVETSNINSQINGSVNGFSSYGYFERGASDFPFANGIMLSTGRAVSGANGQDNIILNEGGNNWLTDPDLEAALGITNTLNATSIEFDFISISNQIQFNYILASEEYFQDFPCNYSDGFAFLIKETGSSEPFRNIALIPGTTIPVNTNTIHPNITGFCPASNGEYFEGYNLGDTNFNGRTTILSATADITPNISYSIKLVIADQTDKNYDSAVFIEGNSFNASVDLGIDTTTCADSLVLDGDIGNPDATYSWYLNTNLIVGENQPSINATQSGSYTVNVEIPLSGSTCIIEDTVEINLSSTQTAIPIPNYSLCDDDSMDGIEVFDLSTRTNEVLASVPNSSYNISYHYTAGNAIANVNAITAPISNTTNNQNIFVRIEDTINGCLAYSSFQLIVNPLPSVTPPSTLMVCDDNVADGITQIDLSESNYEMIGDQTDLIVTFHNTQAQANSGNGRITLPFTNTSPDGQVFVRIRNSVTGCFVTTTLSYSVISSPVISYEDIYVDACDSDHDGMATFDLNSVIDDFIQGLTGVSVTFHETPEDAESGSNPIPNPEAYNNTVANMQQIYIRVIDDTTGCSSVSSFEIHTNLLLTGTEIRDFSECDVDNNGIEQFDLQELAQAIINGLENVSVTFFQLESDRDSNINPLDVSVPFIVSSSPTLIYLTLNSPTCTEVAELELIIYPVTPFPAAGPVNYCDDDADGFTVIDLHSFDELITGGNTNYGVTYFASEEDALANEDPLPDYYTNTTNPVTIYPKVFEVGSECGNNNPFTIHILPAPETLNPEDIVICDSDSDGLVIYDLTQLYSQLVTDTSNKSFDFYGSYDDLVSDTDRFQNVSNFLTNTRGIHVKVSNTGTGCWSNEYFEIIVNSRPNFPSIGNYTYCENASDGIGEFIFSEKDEEILNGQTGKETLYFLSQADADNRVNEIDKNSVYQNVSNPQTIFVRVENLSDTSCYGTSSFLIEIGTNPLFNQPLDEFRCDDITNDTSALFDLTPKLTEITQDDTLDVSFYTTRSNAENEINAIPLEFTNTVNPQQIYVRIDDGSICPSITSFTLNVIQVARANIPEPQTMCDTDYDGIVTFDLTSSEIEILDVRQDNIVISYYDSLESLENGTGEILNPSAYNNVTNPQTVYVKLTNTISGCYLPIPLVLNVNLPPAINDFETINICENEGDTYNLLNVDNLIVDDTSNTIITYYATQVNALSGTDALNTNYTITSNNTTIYARVMNSTTGCFITYGFQLRVRPMPDAIIPNDLTDCDDDYDGLLEFDLTDQTATILGGQNPSNFSVTYYNSLANAEIGTNLLPTNYIAFDGEIIYARVQNNTTACYSITQFPVVIYSKPAVDIPNQVICLENLPLIVSANTNNPTDTYLWSTNETTPEIIITVVGTYSVTVTSEHGCVTTQVFNVIESEQANIDIVETVDFSDPNNITITISGIGNYMFQLDDNTPQESNVFENVGIGYHTVTIIDINGCLEISKEVLVLDFPQFVTPNQDGYFDTWHIIGAERLPGTVIYIYDRYGKQISYLTSRSKGWDGTYNGQNMPSSDYWFVADVKGGGYDFQAKGHFTLKR